ncbi:MAG: N-acetylmuramoyl-L-alanine amidase [Anaerolineae bacterium]|nr:N-acetylmuramoyl-L-alanine amidase [Anaerolineae bacterium]
MASQESRYIYGMHDPDGEQPVREMGTRGWILFVERIFANPQEAHGRDYGRWANDDFGIIARFQHDWFPGGTIPRPDKYGAFAQRIGNYVEHSQGCHIWIIGNETNHEQERPHGQLITPGMYAECYVKCWQQIHSRPGHENDQVVTASVGPWNNTTPYPGNESGDWVQYFVDMLREIRDRDCPVDAIALHTYTQDYDRDHPERDWSHLVTSEATMDAPFDHLHKHFRTYQDYMNAIPRELQRVPVYITETNRNGPWHDHNTGWVQKAYKEIDDWNQTPGHQQIRCLLLYRWEGDQWKIKGKGKVLDDWREAMSHRYVWRTDVEPLLPKEVATPDIEDILSELATHPHKTWETRSLDQIRYLVIHHSAVSPTVGPRRFARYHVDNQDLPGIKYHYVIAKRGHIWQTNALTAISSHAAPVDEESVGICLCGNLLHASPLPEQVDSLAHLCAWLLGELGLPSAEEAIRGRKEFILDDPGADEWSKRDPGDEWDAGARWRDTLLQEVAGLQI